MLSFLQEPLPGDFKIKNLINNIITGLLEVLILPRKYAQLFRIKNGKKIVIGSAGIHQKGWILTDKTILDVTDRNNFLKYWKPESRVAFFAEHVWEHLTDYDVQKANMNCFEFLKSDGRLRIAVPDGYNTNKDYIEKVRPGGSGLGADDHKILYDYKLLSSNLKNTGFRVELLEYWDEKGNFHFKDWDIKYGYVRRSSRFDDRNKDGKLNYTSLIVDAIKP